MNYGFFLVEFRFSELKSEGGQGSILNSYEAPPVGSGHTNVLRPLASTSAHCPLCVYCSTGSVWLNPECWASGGRGKQINKPRPKPGERERERVGSANNSLTYISTPLAFNSIAPADECSVSESWPEDKEIGVKCFVGAREGSG